MAPGPLAGSRAWPGKRKIGEKKSKKLQKMGGIAETKIGKGEGRVAEWQGME